jgi:hypothetical protein
MTGSPLEPFSIPVLHLDPVPVKRYLSLGMLWLLTGLLGYVLVMFPPADTVWLVFLGLVTAATGWLALSTGRATRGGLEFRDEGLFDAEGRCVCRLDEIASVSRGAFAFKPSNGFLLRLTAPGARVWAPGIYWRMGRFVGVGGVTSKAQAEVIAETIALAIKRRRAE